MENHHIYPAVILAFVILVIARRFSYIQRFAEWKNKRDVWTANLNRTEDYLEMIKPSAYRARRILEERGDRSGAERIVEDYNDIAVEVAAVSERIHALDKLTQKATVVFQGPLKSALALYRETFSFTLKTYDAQQCLFPESHADYPLNKTSDVRLNLSRIDAREWSKDLGNLHRLTDRINGIIA